MAINFHININININIHMYMICPSSRIDINININIDPSGSDPMLPPGGRGGGADSRSRQMGQQLAW